MGYYQISGKIISTLLDGR